MRRRHFILAPAAARLIGQPRQEQRGSAAVSAPRAAGTDRRGRAAAAGRSVLAAALAARQAGPDAGLQVVRLTPGPLDEGRGQAFIDAVRGRALAGRPPAATVVLDLTAFKALDSSWCAVLVALDDSLRSAGTRIRLAGVPGRLLPELEKAGLCHRIGADAIHSSVRSA
ncbi:MAG TPA: STAS domain-containing protein, partial [Streptosporangiaceae bacterium]|nr:STAS domain-containing protein [Streptosporangiaceae bacterium]